MTYAAEPSPHAQTQQLTYGAPPPPMQTQKTYAAPIQSVQANRTESLVQRADADSCNVNDADGEVTFSGQSLHEFVKPTATFPQELEAPPSDVGGTVARIGLCSLPSDSGISDAVDNSCLDCDVNDPDGAKRMDDDAGINGVEASNGVGRPDSSDCLDESVADGTQLDDLESHGGLSVRDLLAQVESASPDDGAATSPRAVVAVARLTRALHSAQRAVEAEHRTATAVWRGPLSLVRPEDLEKSPPWVCVAVRRAQQLIDEASDLSDAAECYEAQMQIARREGRGLERAPLLELLHRLDALAPRLHAQLPSLCQAREALDLTLVGGAPPQEDPLAGFTPHSPARSGDESYTDEDIETESEVDTDDDDASLSPGAQLPRVILEPVTPEPPEVPAEGSQPPDMLFRCMEAVLDKIEVVAVATGINSAVEAARITKPSQSGPDCARVDEAARVPDARIEHDCLAHLSWLPSDGIRLLNRARLPKLTTGYWKFRGLGAPMRMMCTYAGVRYIDTQYEVWERPQGVWCSKDWEKVDKPVLKKENAFIQLPYAVNHSTGHVATGSNAVYMYLGRLLGLSGFTAKQKLANEQVLFYIHTMWMEIFDLAYPFKKNKTQDAFLEALDIHMHRTLPDHYEKLEESFGSRGTRFVSGNWSLCAADFHLWEVLDQHECLARLHGFASPLGDFDLLAAFHARVRALPRLREYFEGADARLPLNNKMAWF